MLIKILCNKLLLGRATSQLASCTEPSRAGSLFSRAKKIGSARARSERRADPSRAELLRARASSSSSSFFFQPYVRSMLPIVYGCSLNWTVINLKCPQPFDWICFHVRSFQAAAASSSSLRSKTQPNFTIHSVRLGLDPRSSLTEVTSLH
jgi:hypothetical protein